MPSDGGRGFEGLNPKFSLRRKRFRLVSEQRKIFLCSETKRKRLLRPRKGTFGFDPARNETRALLLAPFFAQSLTLVPRSLLLNSLCTAAPDFFEVRGGCYVHRLLLNRTETLATQAILN